MTDTKKGETHCSFCGRDETQIAKLLQAAPSIAICNECVEAASALLIRDIGKAEADRLANIIQHYQPDSLKQGNGAGDSQQKDEEAEAVADAEFLKKHVPAPAEIKEALDSYVIGQNRAKKVLSVAVYNHYQRLRQNASSFDDHEEDFTDVEIEKSNILLAGPTGSGKTLLAKTLARVLDVPFCIVDATTLTEAGYVGEDVENTILRLLQAADFDVAKAERGIIYIDEIDKIGRKTQNVSVTRDVSGEGVQQALLKIIEGTVCNIPPNGGRKHPNEKYIKVNTEKILFICGGAFVGLEDIIRKRLGSAQMGFGAIESNRNRKEYSEEEVLEQALPEDFFSFGMIPELVGRLPIFSALTTLDEAQLIELLTKPKNALVKQYRKLLALSEVKLVVNQDALSAMAKKAIDRGTGARALRSIFEHLMLDIMFDIPSMDDVRTVTIDAEVVSGAKAPIIGTQQKKIA
ncbi:MAG: ATP-dependent Clp protease ATP-binding subunit ClpX [Akkermansia sp.]